MKKLLILMLSLTCLISNGQVIIGNKKNLRPYKSELTSPKFLEILKDSKKKIGKDSTKIIFNGVSDFTTQKCSFSVYEFRTTVRTYKNQNYKVVDTVREAHYLYQNQKIAFKEVRLKKSNQLYENIIVEYYKDGKPKKLQARLAKLAWGFDAEGNLVKNFDSIRNDDEIKTLDFDNSQFTLEEHKQIRDDLQKIIKNFEYRDRFDWVKNSLKDWETLNKTKKYLKKILKTDIDLYYDGMDQSETYFYTEYGDQYFFSTESQKLRINGNTKIVKGIIIDKFGSIPGAYIEVKHSLRNIHADIDGKFEIIVKKGEVLIVSFIGFGTTEIKIDSKDFYEITLPQYSPPMSRKMKRNIRRNGGVVPEW